MAVATRSTSVTAYAITATAGPYSITKPSGLANGDKLIIVGLIQAGSGATTAPTITTPSGLTKVVDPSATNGYYYTAGAPGGVGIAVFERDCDGTEGASYSFTLGSSQHLTLYAFALTGAGLIATSLYGQTRANGGGADGKTTTLPTITTVANGCFLIEAEGAYDASGSGTNPSGSSPSLTQLYAGTGDGTLFISTGTQTTAGSTGSRTRNPNGNTGSVGFPWQCVLIAIAPSSGGATTNKTVSITATTTTTVAKQVGKTAAITATSATALIKQAGKAVAITATSATSMIRAVGKAIGITATSTTTVAAAKRIAQAVTITATSSVSLLKSVGKLISAQATSSVSISRLMAKTVAVTATSTVSATRAVAKLVAIVATSSVTVNAIKVFLVTVSITATTAVSMLRQVGKIVGITATTSTTLGPRGIAKTVQITATTTTTVQKAVAITRSIVATTAASVSKAIGKLLAITGTTSVIESGTYIPAGAITPQTINITALTSVTVSAQFIPAPPDTGDTHDGGDEQSIKFWRAEQKKKKRKPKPPEFVATPAAEPVTITIEIPAHILAQLDEDDIADIIDLLGL